MNLTERPSAQRQVQFPPTASTSRGGAIGIHTSLTRCRPLPWRSPCPLAGGRFSAHLFLQEEIYLVAGRYHEYRHEDTEPASVVFLRSPDAALATKYLDATQRYVELYSRLLGSYPYKKFALVENFWETGYGMPSFTLLGPRVIRLPFIIHSSYPHEILHNWWGNSVYVAKRGGNWSEGLTAYLADHLLAEQRGRGAVTGGVSDAEIRGLCWEGARNCIDGLLESS